MRVSQTQVRVWWSCEEMQKQEGQEWSQEMQCPRPKGPGPSLGLKLPGRLRKAGLSPPGKSLAPAGTQVCRVVILLEAPSTSPSGRATGGFQVCWPPEEKPFAPALEGARSPEGDQTHECRGSSSVGAAQPFRVGGPRSLSIRDSLPFASKLRPQLPLSRLPTSRPGESPGPAAP